MLYCEQAPPFGGETGFADTYCTLQGLPFEKREALRGMTCIHDFDDFRYKQGRAGVSPETVEELRSSYPVADHPMVRTHPDTGGEMLCKCDARQAAFARHSNPQSRLGT